MIICTSGQKDIRGYHWHCDDSYFSNSSRLQESGCRSRRWCRFWNQSFQSQTQSEEFKLELIQLRRLSHLYKFSQLIRYSRACTQYNGFFSGLSLATDGNTTQTKLRSPRLKSAMEKFDWFYLWSHLTKVYYDFVNRCEIICVTDDRFF